MHHFVAPAARRTATGHFQMPVITEFASPSFGLPDALSPSGVEPMSPQTTTRHSYTVEVSGWDAQERFFVEKTELEWDEQAGKRIRMRTPIERGTVLFIRLFDAAALDSLPVAYEAREIRRHDTSSFYEVSLVQRQPQRGRSAAPAPRGEGEDSIEV
jgi:hypothetical protein